MRISSRPGEYLPSAELSVIVTPADVAVIHAALGSLCSDNEEVSRVCYELAQDFDKLMRDVKILPVN